MEIIITNRLEGKSILKYPDKGLRKISKEVKEDELAFDMISLISDMRKTMYFNGGIGLAAPQIGVLKRVIIINLTPNNKDSEIIMINPVITKGNDKTRSAEGCLSIPGYNNDVIRQRRITVDYIDSTGAKKTITATKQLSCAIQHEIDHLNGKLFIDRLKDKPRNLFTQVYGKESS